MVVYMLWLNEYVTSTLVGSYRVQSEECVFCGAESEIQMLIQSSKNRRRPLQSNLPFTPSIWQQQPQLVMPTIDKTGGCLKVDAYHRELLLLRKKCCGGGGPRTADRGEMR